MDPILDMLYTVAVTIGGLLLRFLVALAIVGLAILVLTPFVVGAEAVRRGWARATGFEEIGGLLWRSGVYYTPVHTWLRRRAQWLRIGFDDVAARVLRHLDNVILPREGVTLRAGDPMLTLTSGARRFAVPAPISGVVRRVNQRVLEQPDAIVRDPYGRGWLMELSPIDGEYVALPHDAKARGWFADETNRLSHALDHATGIVAADGGDLAVPPHMVLSDAQLDALARDFLAARAVT